MTGRPSAFLFDMDGVIVNSTEIHTATWEEYLGRFDLRIPDIGQRMLGKHNDDIVREFFPDHLTPEAIFEHGAAKEQLYRERIEPVFDRYIVPGVVDFVRRHASIPMAVASNAEPANVEFVLSLAGIRDRFKAVVNGHDVERPKPHPEIFLKAARDLGADPARCIVFEDSDTGVAAARNAGMRVVALLTTIPKFDNVDLAVNDFTEPALEDWLASAGFR